MSGAGTQGRIRARTQLQWALWMFWCERRDHKWWGIDRALTAPEDGDVRTCLRCGTQDQWGPWPPLAADPTMRWVCIR